MLKWNCKFKCLLGPNLWQLRGDWSRTGQGKSSTQWWESDISERKGGGEEAGLGRRSSDHTIHLTVTGNPIESSKIKISHSSILAWRIPWTEEPGRQQSMGSQRVRYDWARVRTHARTHTHTHTHQALGLRPCSVMARGQLPRKALPLFKGQKRIPKVLTTGSSQLTTLLAAEWQILSWKKIQAAHHHRCHDINKYKHQYENYVINYLRWTAAY